MREGVKGVSVSEERDMKRVGFDSSLDRSGVFIQEDHSPAQCAVEQEGLEILPLEEAFSKYGWVKDISWKLVKPDRDEVTREVYEKGKGGYFIRALPGAKIRFPVQSCLYIKGEGVVQRLHNIVVVEEGSEMILVTGCVSHEGLGIASHLAVSEFYVRKGARLVSSMIHSWGEGISVRPRSCTFVEEGGRFISNYVSMDRVGVVDMYPVCVLSGNGASASISTIIYARSGSRYDVGGKVVFASPETSGEVISRVVSSGGEVISRGHLVGKSPGCKGHLECRGLLVGKGGFIHAIPELESRVSDVDLSHEAAVGKIAKEELEYLMARGIDEESATSLIVKGFLSVDVEGLPEFLRKRIERLIEKTREEGI